MWHERSMSEFKDLHDNHSAEGDVKLELAMGSFLGGDGLGHDSMGGFSRVLSLPDMEAFGQEEED